MVMAITMSKLLFTTAVSVLAHFFNTGCCCRTPPDPPRPPDRATPSSHGSTRSISERTGPNAKFDERGASKGALPGTAFSIPEKGADPRGGRVSNIVGGISLPGFSFRAPCLGFQLYGRRLFSEDGTLSSAGDIFSCPREFGLSGRASDSVLTGQWFEPCLLPSFLFPFFV